MSTSANAKSSSYHHGDLRSALIDAGVELLEREGVDSLSLRAAARIAGVSHAAPARHFPDADTFLAAIATVGYQRLSAKLKAASRKKEGLEGFQAMGRAYVKFGLENPNWYRAIFHPSLADKHPHPELLEASATAFGLLREGIEASVSAGAVRSGDSDGLALLVWSTVHGLAVLMIDDQLRTKGYSESDDQLIERVLTNMFLGLGNR